MVAFFISRPLRQAKRLSGVDLDLGSISATLSKNQVFQ